MKLGIVGQGFVGTAVKEVMSNYYECNTFDIKQDCTCDTLRELVTKSDIIFVCVPLCWFIQCCLRQNNCLVWEGQIVLQAPQPLEKKHAVSACVYRAFKSQFLIQPGTIYHTTSHDKKGLRTTSITFLICITQTYQIHLWKLEVQQFHLIFKRNHFLQSIMDRNSI